jgi:hypothetical protein
MQMLPFFDGANAERDCARCNRSSKDSNSNVPTAFLFTAGCTGGKRTCAADDAPAHQGVPGITDETGCFKLRTIEEVLSDMNTLKEMRCDTSRGAVKRHEEFSRKTGINKVNRHTITLSP